MWSMLLIIGIMRARKGGRERDGVKWEEGEKRRDEEEKGGSLYEYEIWGWVRK